MSIQYKFKNTNQYQPIKFDGVCIPVSDLKKIIIQQNKIGDSDVQIENEETGQVYTDDQQISKNTHLVIMRKPLAHKRPRLANGNNNAGQSQHHGLNNHHHNRHNNNHNNTNANSITYPTPTLGYNSSSSNYNKEALELVTRASTKTQQLTEEEKLKKIQQQSSFDIASKYQRTNNHYHNNNTYNHNNNNTNLSGNVKQPNATRTYQPRPNSVPGQHYVCRKCGIPGHWKQDCNAGSTRDKRASGIPKAFMRTADAQEQGALLTATGEYAVPIINDEAYKNPKIEKAPFFEEERTPVTEQELPDCFKCDICENPLVDAVITMGCCKKIFCDNCIRNSLIESDTHECPMCHKQDVSPETLIPSTFYRRAVAEYVAEDPLDLFINHLKGMKENY